MDIVKKNSNTNRYENSLFEKQGMDAQNSEWINPAFAKTRKAILERLGEVTVYNKKHHFLLVHEGGHGAWCWYKTADLLQKAGHKATVFDLVGSGLHPTHPSHVSSFQEYIHPLINVLHSIKDPDKVVLVGHGLGGMAVAYSSEMFASKIAVGVYLAGIMLPGGLQALIQEMDMLGDTLEDDDESMDLFWDKANEPIIETWKEKLYNMSPSQDIQLASTLLRHIPVAAKEAKVEITDQGYKSVPRIYIKIDGDQACPMKAQHAMIKKNPPNRVLSLQCDHSPFFSACQQLHQMLVGVGDTYDR